MAIHQVPFVGVMASYALIPSCRLSVVRVMCTRPFKGLLVVGIDSERLEERKIDIKN